MSTILITGAGGFVGANLCAHLAAQGHDVHAVLHRPLSENFRRSLLTHPKIKCHPADLQNAEAVRGLLQSTRPQLLLNTAVYGSDPAQTDTARMWAVNSAVVDTLLSALKGTDIGFVQTGTCFEYGPQPHAIAETDAPHPVTEYAKAKLHATQAVLADGRPACVLRLFTPYGPFDHPLRLIPSVMQAALDGKPPVLSRPWPVRDYLYIHDVCRAFEAAGQRLLQGEINGQVINIGSGVQHSVQQTAEEILSIAGRPADIVWSGEALREFDPKSFRAGISKAQSVLGWAPLTDFHAGLERTWAWRRQHALAPGANL